MLRLKRLSTSGGKGKGLKNKDMRLEGIQQAWQVEEVTKGEHFEISLLLESKGSPQVSLHNFELKSALILMV